MGIMMWMHACICVRASVCVRLLIIVFSLPANESTYVNMYV